MKLFSRKLGALAAATHLTISLAGAAGTELYVRNKPFKGTVASAEGQLWVELPAFAKALGAELVSNPQGGHLLSLDKSGSAEGVPANTVMIGGTAVEARVDGGVVLVPLDKTAALLNAKVINNKQMGTIDVNVGGPVQASAGADGVAADLKPTKPAKNIIRVTGKVTVPGANMVGLFTGGSASEPYKKGTVDRNGNYVMEIDVTKDLHGNETDMRFFMDGAFERSHGRCNFIHYNAKTKTAVLMPYGSNDQVVSKDGQLQYSEADN